MAGQNFMYRDSTGKEKNGFAIQTSAGAGSAGSIVALNASGQVDPTMIPPGYENQVRSILTSEIIAAGAYVSIFNNSGTPNVRNADNGTPGKEANGFVLAGFGSAATATVYLGGPNNGLTGLTIGTRYFLGAVGAVTTTPPDPTNAGNAGKFIQFLGEATNTGELNTQLSEATYL